MTLPSLSPESTVPEPLPAGSILAHIGVHKTGTTALQSVLSQQRDVLAQHGVCYPGTADNHHNAALSLTGTKWGRSRHEGRALSPSHWPTLVAETRAASGRVVLSSEFFADTRDPHGEQFRDDLGRDRLHVVVGVRPLPLVLASAWQQSLKLGRPQSFDEWLQKVYLGSRKGNARSFWARYTYAATVDRWSEWVGPDRVTVVVLDEADHSWLPRVFESLLALPAGVITGVKPELSNRSFTAAEAAGLRRANEMMDGSIDWITYEPMIRKGAVMHMVENRSAAVEEQRIAVPDWAAQHAAEEGRLAVEGIRAAGVRVLGRLESLAEVPARMLEHPVSAQEATAINNPESVPIEVFAQAVVGTVDGARISGVRPAGPIAIDDQLVRETTAGDLLRALIGRLKRRAARLLQRA